MIRILILIGVFLYVELRIVDQVMDILGVWSTVLLLVLTALLGSRLVKWAGVTTLQHMATKLQSGAAIGQECAEGAILLLAGALFFFPGFLSDLLAVLLLLPPVRRPMARLLAHLVRRYHARTRHAHDTIIEGVATQETEPARLPLPPPDGK